MQREIGRRVWMALCSQDWLCSTSQGVYSIQKRHYTSTAPGAYHEDTFEPIVDDTPSYVHIGNYLNEVAYLLVCYHDEMLGATDITSRYQVVIKYDSKMRHLFAEQMPACI